MKRRSDFILFLHYTWIISSFLTDCLKLLDNLLHSNASNQVLLRETVGFDPLISLLKLRGSAYSFSQQKVKYSIVYSLCGFCFFSMISQANRSFAVLHETNNMPVDN
ncbi:uncharacterized protein LOC128295482 [Gossypium arboreum]|uniref:uncharacterized protein LOC128295482 n=1 Tax=Gossypium arboreum TaxID=29729 RepID=UPI0022F19370|nr:uncharacterized protein LOC128295482 [Gossypium arboreum]